MKTILVVDQSCLTPELNQHPTHSKRIACRRRHPIASSERLNLLPCLLSPAVGHLKAAQPFFFVLQIACQNKLPKSCQLLDRAAPVKTSDTAYNELGWIGLVHSATGSNPKFGFTPSQICPSPAQPRLKPNYWPNKCECTHLGSHVNFFHTHLVNTTFVHSSVGPIGDITLINCDILLHPDSIIALDNASSSS